MKPNYNYMHLTDRWDGDITNIALPYHPLSSAVMAFPEKRSKLSKDKLTDG
jgi:hypothetical protein